MARPVEALLADYITWRHRIDPPLRVLHLQDFLTGAEDAPFARAAGVKGEVLDTYRREPDEGHAPFVKRAAASARGAGARRLVVGGLDCAAVLGDSVAPLPATATETRRLRLRLVRIPNPLHAGQLALLRVILASRYAVGSCGRRLGKSVLAEVLAADDFALGRATGLFFPTFKYAAPVVAELRAILTPIIGEISEQKNTIIGLDGLGTIDWWTLQEDERAGRGREYDRIILDEAAFNKPSFVSSYETAMRPLLINRKGSVVALSTPNGVREDEFFYRVAHMKELGWAFHQSPTHDNPLIDRDELEAMEKSSHPLIYQQEILARFVDISAFSVFPLDKLLENGAPIPFPARANATFAVVDTGLKGGTDNDATAAVYFAVDVEAGTPGRLTILDYDVTEIGRGGIAVFLSAVQATLTEYTIALGAAAGSYGVYIEDAAAGAVLLYDAPERGINSQPIDEALTKLGKDGRALEAEVVMSAGLVRITDHAWYKTVTLRGITRNALTAQISAFRIADPAAQKRADDLLDLFTYGCIIGIHVSTVRNWVMAKARAEAKARRKAEAEAA